MSVVKGTFTLLMDLPCELLSAVLCNWLDFRALVRLDSAMCTHQSRLNLLELFASNRCVFASMVNFENSRTVNWFRSRKLQVSNLTVSAVFPELVTFFRLYSGPIRHVKCLSSRALSIVAIHVRNLATISYVSAATVFELSDAIWLNVNLKELRLETVDNLSMNLAGLSLPHLYLLSLYDTPCNDELLGRIVSTTCVLRKIELSHCKLVTDAGVIGMAQLCPHLNAVGLDDLPICDGALTQLAELCPCITNLTIALNSVVTDLGVRAIAKRLRSLRGLCINRCKYLTDASLQHLTQCDASTLQELRAAGLPSVRVDVLVASLQKCPHLHTLSIDCDLNAYHAEVVPHLCNLQALVTYSLLSDSCLCTIAQHCKDHRQLAIFSTVAPSTTANALIDTPVEPRVMYCANAKSAFENRIYTEKGLMALMDGLPQLRVLGVHEKEILQGFLTPLAQGVWRRLRPHLDFQADLEYFTFDSLLD